MVAMRAMLMASSLMLGSAQAGPHKDSGPSYSAASTSTTSTATPAPSGSQQIAWASYIDPSYSPGSDYWKQLISYDSDKFTILVANVLNGPDSTTNPDWQSAITKATANGKKVLGYVRTGYLGLNQAQFTTRLGAHDVDSWVSQIEQDVAAWYSLYTNISGIFFDEGWPECGPNNIYSNIYAYINANTKRDHSGAYTVLNPGSQIAQCYENTMDSLMSFENSFERYTTDYVPNNWNATDPRKIWHIIYDVPQQNISQVAQLARDRGAGLVQITDKNLPNPYDSLPTSDYMSILLSAVSGGTLAPAGAAPYPPATDAAVAGSLATLFSDYTSVVLGWSGSGVGFRVYDNGVAILDVPGSMNNVTIGQLQPGSTHTFKVVSVDCNGTDLTQVGSVSVTTTAFPNGHPITSFASGNDDNGDIYFQAGLLEPFGAARLFQCQPWDYTATNSPAGWTIAYSSTQNVKCSWMVDGLNVYQYNPNAAAGTWDWLLTGSATLSSSGYTNKWTFADNGDSTGYFIIQAAGYAPTTQAFSTCDGLGATSVAGNFCGNS